MTKPPRQWNSTLPQRSRPIKNSGTPTRKAKVKPRNAKRRASEFARAYGSRERVRWVKAQPCVVCSAIPSENVHVVGGGMGRKADCTMIVPMCHPHHLMLHRIGVVKFEDDMWPLAEVSVLKRLADYTERRWQSHLASRSPAPSENR